MCLGHWERFGYTSAPMLTTIRRNGRSVTPVIGARITGDSIRTGPMAIGFSICMGAGEIGAKVLAGKVTLG